MKQIYITRLFSRLIGLAVLGGMFACSGEEEEPGAVATGVSGVSVVLKTGSKAAAGLDFSVYVFEKPSDSSTYVFKNSFVLTGQQGKLELEEEELQANDYRFLFLALPAGGEDIKAGRLDASTLRAGDAWEDLRLTRTAAPLSDAVYYKVEDVSGGNLLDTRLIRVTLERLIGRMVFDCFKVANASSQDPIGIDAASGVASVLDRVYKIEITYGSPVQQLSFQGTTLTPLPSLAPQEVQTISLPEEDNLKVTVPQADLGLLKPYGADGCVRILGLNLLPTGTAMPVTLTFRYYDTTPVCQSGSDPAHTHTSACYAESSLVLNLQVANGEGKNAIRPGYLTINKSAILFNRIIDLPAGATLDVDFSWDLSNLPNYN